MADVTQSFAATFVDELAAQGVEFACVSPGSRSAPIAMALQRHPRIKVLIHIDERCGSFFALGLGKATGRPAVVLTTSGSAAAEAHAAVVEAAYSRTPLIVLTADRPPELQDVGANQAIDQQRLFGAPPALYTSTCRFGSRWSDRPATSQRPRARRRSRPLWGARCPARRRSPRSPRLCSARSGRWSWRARCARASV
jgi:2-succinyl-5-enolpyruvyl-6-hydroxy-3-cyclohexene-1-carboxylate synthase